MHSIQTDALFAVIGKQKNELRGHDSWVRKVTSNARLLKPSWFEEVIFVPTTLNSTTTLCPVSTGGAAVCFLSHAGTCESCTSGTHVSTPAVGGEDLVLLVQVEDLDERQSVLDGDGLRRVVHRTANFAHALVVVQQVLDQSLLIRQGYSVCKKQKRNVHGVERER